VAETGWLICLVWSLGEDLPAQLSGTPQRSASSLWQ
jgi:hypothetical protein